MPDDKKKIKEHTRKLVKMRESGYYSPETTKILAILKQRNMGGGRLKRKARGRMLGGARSRQF